MRGRWVLVLVLSVVCSGWISAVDKVEDSLPAQTMSLEMALNLAEQNSPTMKKVKLSRERSRQSLLAQKASTKANFSLGLEPFSYSNKMDFDTRYSSWYNYEYLASSSNLSISQPIVATNTTIVLQNVFGWQKTYSNYSGTATSNKMFINDFYLSLSQPLFTFNSRKSTLKQLKLDVEQAEISYALASLSLERTVTTLFYSAYMAQLQLDIAVEEWNNTQKSRDVVADKVETGMAASVELYQADLNLASARLSIQNKKVSLENSLIRLKQYLGYDLNADIRVVATIEINESLIVDREMALEKGMAARMEIRQQQMNLEYQQLYSEQVKDINDFDASIDLSIGLTSNNELLRRVYDKPSRSPSIGVSLSIPLYDWGERKARIKAQEATLQSSKIDLEVQQTDIRVEIGELCRNLENYKSQMDIERQSQRNAELAYAINQEKFSNGDLTSMDLNLYQSQLSARRIALVQAQINYKLALLNLKIATLYDVERHQPVVIQY
jgi:outer membrane protein